MAGTWKSALGSPLAWLLFPIAPAVLSSFFYRIANWTESDPRQWGTWDFCIFLGPLVGLSYLAGATATLSDDAPGRFGRRWPVDLARKRSLWVALGPWSGCFAIWAWLVLMQGLDALMVRALSPARLDAWRGASVVDRIGLPREWLMLGVFGFGAYGWLLVAVLAAIRARRRGRFWRSFKHGLLTSIGFVGSLIGSFWAATSAFRGYFFDPRIAPLIVLSLIILTTLAGCSSPPTLGDLRRRELFQALSVSWVLGLALVWRWLSRERK